MFRAPAVPDAEPRLRDAAATIGAAYRRISARRHAFEIATRPGRTQVVYLDVLDPATALVRSRIGKYGPSLPARLLLTRNAENQLGSIAVEDVEAIPYVVLRAHCRIDHPAVLRQTLALSAWTADELERDLFGHDVE